MFLRGTPDITAVSNAWSTETEGTVGESLGSDHLPITTTIRCEVPPASLYTSLCLVRKDIYACGVVDITLPWYRVSATDYQIGALKHCQMPPVQLGKSKETLYSDRKRLLIHWLRLSRQTHREGAHKGVWGGQLQTLGCDLNLPTAIHQMWGHWVVFTLVVEIKRVLSAGKTLHMQCLLRRKSID